MSLFASTPTSKTHPLNRALHDDDWCLFQVARPNVLLIGPEVDTDLAVASITGWGEERTCFWPAPPDMSQFETLIVRNVIDLDWREQGELNRWLAERSEAIRVIATARVPPYGLVEHRLFLEALYYRLNVVCLDAHDLQPAAV
jgi:hypothetical protein